MTIYLFDFLVKRKLCFNKFLISAHTYCLSFYYHMYGSGMGTLKVQTQTGSENPVTLWMMSGNQGTKWHRLYRLAIPLDQNTKVTQSVMHATGIILYQDNWFVKTPSRYLPQQSVPSYNNSPSQKTLKYNTL